MSAQRIAQLTKAYRERRITWAEYQAALDAIATVYGD